MSLLHRLFRRAVPSLFRCKDVEGPVKALDGRNPRVRKEALRALGELGPEAVTAVQPLGEKLKTRDWVERRDVVRVLGKIGKDSPVAATILVDVLHDRSKAVRQEAIAALANLGGDAVMALSDAPLSEPDDLVDRAAVLGDLGLYHRAISDMDQAISAKTKGERLAPIDSWLLEVRGTLKREAGIIAGAIEDISQAIQGYSRLKRQVKPKWPLQAYAIRGDVWGMTEHLKAQGKLAALGFSKARAYFERGLCYLKLGDITRGKQDLKKAVELRPAFRKRVERVLDEYPGTDMDQPC